VTGEGEEGRVRKKGRRERRETATGVFRC